MTSRTRTRSLSVVGIVVGIVVGVGVGAYVCRRIQMQTYVCRCKQMQTDVCKEIPNKAARKASSMCLEKSIERPFDAFDDVKMGPCVDEMSKNVGTEAASPKKASKGVP